MDPRDEYWIDKTRGKNATEALMLILAVVATVCLPIAAVFAICGW